VDAHIGAPLQGYNTVEVGGQILKIGVWVRRSDVAIFLLSLRNISNIMGQNFSIAIRYEKQILGQGTVEAKAR